MLWEIEGHSSFLATHKIIFPATQNIVESCRKREIVVYVEVTCILMWHNSAICLATSPSRSRFWGVVLPFSPQTALVGRRVIRLPQTWQRPRHRCCKKTVPCHSPFTREKFISIPHQSFYSIMNLLSKVEQLTVAWRLTIFCRDKRVIQWVFYARIFMAKRKVANMMSQVKLQENNINEVNKSLIIWRPLHTLSRKASNCQSNKATSDNMHSDSNRYLLGQWYTVNIVQYLLLCKC